MITRKILIKIGLLWVVCFFFAPSGKAQNRQNTSTGDLKTIIEKDGKGSTYEEKKQNWIENNRSAYQNQEPATSNTSATNTQQDDANKEIKMPWGIPANKNDWVKSHPVEYEQMKASNSANASNGLPWKNDAAKAQWVKENKAEAQKMKIIEPSTNTHEIVEESTTSSPLSPSTIMVVEKTPVVRSVDLIKKK